MPKLSTLLAAILFMPVTACICLGANKQFPSVLIKFPPALPSESVQISYFMVGPFGGAGNLVRPSSHVHSYTVEAASCHIDISTTKLCSHDEGLAATNIKFIIYASGCQIATFDFDLGESSTIEQEFVCQPLRTHSLSGQVLNKQILLNKPHVLSIEYDADWESRFFGFSDGAITIIRLATTTLDENGAFKVRLPDLGIDPIASTREGYLLLFVKEAEKGNILGELEPVDKQITYVGLSIQPAYPPDLAFNLKLFPETSSPQTESKSF